MGFQVKLRGARRPWAEWLATPLEARHAYIKALDHGLSPDRVIIIRVPGNGRELAPVDFPWDHETTKETHA